MNLDRISLNDIFDGLGQQKKTFDLKMTEKKYHNSYPNALKQYALVNPYEIKTTINKGDKIKYIKKNTNIVSCAASVVGITKDSFMSDFFLLLTSVVKRNILWKIYPSDHHIFIFNKYMSDSDITSKIRDIYEKNGKSYTEINVSQNTRNKLLINNTKKYVKSDLDEKLDMIIGKHQDRSSVSYTGKKIHAKNVDDIVDSIFRHEIKKNKKSNIT
jgi:hypothetical protein